MKKEYINMDFTIPKYLINDRIVFNSTAGQVLWSHTGTIIGYSTFFPVMYIIKLDFPLEHEDFKDWTGIVAVGSMMDYLQ